MGSAKRKASARPTDAETQPGTAASPAKRRASKADDAKEDASAAVVAEVSLPSKQKEAGAKSTKRKAATPHAKESVVEGASDAAAAATGGEDAGPAKKVPKKRTMKEPEPPKPRYEESMRPPPPDKPATRLISWNVGGLRSLLKKDPSAITKLLEREQPNIICMQEIRISDDHVEGLEAAVKLQGWHATWNCSTSKAGYSGVVTFSKDKPLSFSRGIGHDVDTEGRVVVTEHPDFWLINAYVPNAGEGLKRLSLRTDEWDPALSKCCKELEAKGKPVILAGDLNCAPKEIDIHSPKTNLKSAGFTPEERASFQASYFDQGLVDTFRAQYPDVAAYTYFSHRFKSREQFKGWRLDMFLASSQLVPRCHDSFILADVLGSDHVPIGLVLTQPE